MEIPASVKVTAELMDNNAEFRKLKLQHAEYERRLNELGERRYPSQEEQTEEARLKKLKLNLKDQMQHIVDEYNGHVH